MAEKLFHYDVREVPEGGINHDLENAASLSSALLVSLLVPWGLCFFFYFGEAFTHSLLKHQDNRFLKKLENLYRLPTKSCIC